MNIIYVLLCSVSITAVSFVSTTIRENKLYTISKNDSDNNFQVIAYELKDGSIKDIFSNGTSYSLPRFGPGLDLKLFDAPDALQEDHNKLWLKAEQTDYRPEIDNSNSNFMGYINLNDMTFNPGSSFIKFPINDNFPQSGYTMNKITNKYGSVLYIIGGVVYSKSLDAYISSNSFFKYNFDTKVWKDLTPDVKGKLNPIYSHKSIVIDNRYIFLFGGKIVKDPTKDSILNINNNDLFKVNSVYNLTKFDTVTNNWQSIALNTSMFDSSVTSLQLTDFSANYYSNKIYTLGGFATSNEKQLPARNTKLGILDVKGNQWSWSPVFDEDGNIYSSPIEAKYSLIYNDQILLISDHSSASDSKGFQVFNLRTQRMQSTLELSKSDNDNSNQTKDQSSLPSYGIALIAIGCTVLIMLVIFSIYLKYNRIRATLQNHITEPKKSMEAVWSNPEDPNMEHILCGIKENSIYFNSEFRYSGPKLENPLIEKANNTQGHFTPSLGTTNTSATL